MLYSRIWLLWNVCTTMETHKQWRIDRIDRLLHRYGKHAENSCTFSYTSLIVHRSYIKKAWRLKVIILEGMDIMQLLCKNAETSHCCLWTFSIFCIKGGKPCHKDSSMTSACNMFMTFKFISNVFVQDINEWEYPWYESE